ncbi:MAG: flavodoxin [Eubacteriales bacterium]|nr:flavodoxin [Eubacteriales bacterium]
MKKALVVYYSRRGENHMPGGIQVLETGNTAYAARYIREAVEGDIFEIDTVKPYPAGYKACCLAAVAEMTAHARPEIKGPLPDVSGYDTVFVCYPIWCGTAPMPVFTFLECFDWTGKKVAPLCTHEGSGLANSVRDLEKACKGAQTAPGLAIQGHKARDSREEIAAWALENL